MIKDHATDDHRPFSTPWCAREAIDDFNQAMKNLWDELEAGYIIGDGKWECGLCGRKAIKPEEVKHEDGCIEGLVDKINFAGQKMVDLFRVEPPSIINPGESGNLGSEACASSASTPDVSERKPTVSDTDKKE